MVHKRSFRIESLTSSTLSPGRIVRRFTLSLSTMLALCLTPALIWGFSVGSPLNDLVINEIMKDPVAVSDVHGEYIELYNPNPYSVQINDWVIMDLGNDYHIISSPDPLIVEPHSYFVLARDSSAATNGGFSADYQYSSFTLSNESDEVVLVNTSNYTVDSLIYDSVSFPHDAGYSLELRNPLFNNVHGYNWISSEASYGLGDHGTPGVRNSIWEAYKDVTLDVEIDSLVVPVGDSAEFQLDLTAQSSQPEDVILFGDIWMPDGSPFFKNPVYGPIPLSFDVEERWEKIVKIQVPTSAQLGDYRLAGYLLDEVGQEIDREEIMIRVVPER